MRFHIFPSLIQPFGAVFFARFSVQKNVETVEHTKFSLVYTFSVYSLFKRPVLQYISGPLSACRLSVYNMHTQLATAPRMLLYIVFRSRFARDRMTAGLKPSPSSLGQTTYTHAAPLPHIQRCHLVLQGKKRAAAGALPGVPGDFPHFGEIIGLQDFQNRALLHTLSGIG